MVAPKYSANQFITIMNVYPFRLQVDRFYFSNKETDSRK